MESLWSAQTKRNHTESGYDNGGIGGNGSGNIKTDVLIIGGGIAGILTAYMLEEAGVDYILLEADTICSGVTRNTTAKITSQHGFIYSRLIKEYGVGAARLYYEANENAGAEYERICRDGKIECNYEKTDSYVYSTSDIKALTDEIRAADKIGCNAEAVSAVPIPVDIIGAMKFSGQAQYNPLSFLYNLAGSLRIYEHTPVRRITGHTAVCDGVTFTADKIIVATHFPFINRHGAYFLKLYQERSYVIAVEGAPNVGGMYADNECGGLSFRNYGKYLLIGGGDSRTGRRSTGWRELIGFAHEKYPGCRIAYKWATQDCMTLDGMPYIGQYGAASNGLYVATGFNKWGMTSSMAAALLLRDMMTGVKNPYERLFSPSRTVMHKQLAVNIGHAAVDLLTLGSRRCPHLGCALKWNRAEHTWDCPCHGSRFTRDGGLIDNPAVRDMKKIR